MAKQKQTKAAQAKKAEHLAFSISPRRLLGISAGITLILFGVMGLSSQGLITAAAPAGIFSWELTPDPLSIQRMIESWNTRTRLLAAFGLGLDYLFMLSYAVMFNTACYALGRLLTRNAPGWARLASWFAGGAWLAAGLDAVENIGLLQGLLNGPTAAWQSVAAGCAAVKFTLLGLILLYLAGGGLWAVVSGRRSKPSLRQR
ncbi:MAG: hypothetical protein ACOY16_11475 [Chloroflexota bacterium]